MGKVKKKSKDKTAKKALKKALKLSKSAAKTKPSSKSGTALHKKPKKSDVKPVKEKKSKKSKKEKREKTGRIGKVIVRRSTTPPVHIPRPAPVKLSREMQEVRSRLQKMLGDMRRNIDHEVRGASDRDMAHINDTSDMASDAADGDLALRIAESETVEASEIERALEKIETGTYGTCEMCNHPIAATRLEYLPYVTLCIKCQALAEIRRREDGDELDDLAEGAEQDAENN